MSVSTGYRVLIIDDLKAISEEDRGNGMLMFVGFQDCWYEFDEFSGLPPDDDLVVAPNAGTGQWIKQVPSGGGGGSSTPNFPIVGAKPTAAPPTTGMAIADLRADRNIIWVAAGTSAPSDWRAIGGTIYLLNPAVTDASSLNFFYPPDYNGQMLVIRTTPTGRLVFIAFEGAWTQIYSGS